MDCRDCALWDDKKERCRDGKINPRKYDDALCAAQVLGVRAICIFNDHRERIVGVRTGAPMKEQK
jgi:hypothetical protein